MGEYQLFKYKPPDVNDYHFVNITKVLESNVYTWKTRNGAKWNLTLVSSEEEKEEDRGTLTFDVGVDCPYYGKRGYTSANLYYNTDEVQIEGPWKEMFTKLGGSSTASTTTATTSIPSIATTNPDASRATSTMSPPSDSTTTVLLSAGAGIILVLLLIAAVAIITYKRSQKKKMEKEGRREEVVDENPVYQQYQLVGEKYERQCSTHEVVDCNDYYA